MQPQKGKQFPLIKLAKKLKVSKLLEAFGFEDLFKFPLIKLAKKLKGGTRGLPRKRSRKFPLIKLAKKLKDVTKTGGCVYATVSIN